MGTYKIWLDGGDIIRGYIEGVHTRENAENMINDVFKLAEENGNLKKLLIDMSNVERSTIGGRRVHANTMKSERIDGWKIALYDANIMNKVMANFIIRVSGRGDRVKYFESENNAVEWLG